MQDVAREIAALLEPTEPIGHRLVIFGPRHKGLPVLFEAKGVPFKGGVGFLVRCVSPINFKDYKVPPPVEELPTQFAPTEDALKFLIRKVYNLEGYNSVVALMHAGYAGYSIAREHGSQEVKLGVGYNHFEVGEANSRPERALSEAVAALTVMSVPEKLKWSV